MKAIFLDLVLTSAIIAAGALLEPYISCRPGSNANLAGIRTCINTLKMHRHGRIMAGSNKLN